MSLEFFQEEPTEQDMQLIEIAAKQIFYILYQHENISRVNTIRALVTVIEQVIEEWMLEIGIALKDEIPDKKELSQAVFQNYLDTHVAVVLSCIGHIAKQNKRAPIEILKTCMEVLKKKNKSNIILPNDPDEGIITL